MKKTLWIVTIVAVAALLAMGTACSSSPESAPEKKDASAEAAPAEPDVKRPVILDHENRKWGDPVPEWVKMDGVDLEKQDDYEGQYVFVVESPVSQSLDGAKMAATNFGVMAQVSQMINTRVQNKFSGAQVGDQDSIETYMEQVTKTLSEAQISGLRQERDYWVKQRYFDADGEVEKEAYTVKMLYTIDQAILDELVKSAVDGTEPETEEAQRAKDLVQGELSEGL